MWQQYKAQVPLTLKDVAKFMNVSPVYASRIIQATLGYGFKEYLMDLRLAYAASMLMYTEESISNIKKHYQPFREGWEHDHCEFYETRIDSSLPFAYATEDDYHWFCAECYQDSKEMFQWKMIDETIPKK